MSQHSGAVGVLALASRLLIVVEFAFDPIRSTVEQIDGRPEQVLEIRFKPATVHSTTNPIRDRFPRAR